MPTMSAHTRGGSGGKCRANRHEPRGRSGSYGDGTPWLLSGWPPSGTAVCDDVLSAQQGSDARARERKRNEMRLGFRPRSRLTPGWRGLSCLSAATASRSPGHSARTSAHNLAASTSWPRSAASTASLRPVKWRWIPCSTLARTQHERPAPNGADVLARASPASPYPLRHRSQGLVNLSITEPMGWAYPPKMIGPEPWARNDRPTFVLKKNPPKVKISRKGNLTPFVFYSDTQKCSRLRVCGCSIPLATRTHSDAQSLQGSDITPYLRCGSATGSYWRWCVRGARQDPSDGGAHRSDVSLHPQSAPSRMLRGRKRSRWRWPYGRRPSRSPASGFREWLNSRVRGYRVGPVSGASPNRPIKDIPMDRSVLGTSRSILANADTAYSRHQSNRPVPPVATRWLHSPRGQRLRHRPQFRAPESRGYILLVPLGAPVG